MSTDITFYRKNPPFYGVVSTVFHTFFTCKKCDTGFPGAKSNKTSKILEKTENFFKKSGGSPSLPDLKKVVHFLQNRGSLIAAEIYKEETV